MSRLLRSAPLLLVLAALPLSAQFYNAPANRVTKANGEPSGSLCAASGDVGKVYVVANSASTASPLRICTNTGIGTFAWESSGGGSGSVTPADIEAATWCLAASGSGTTYTCATTNSAALALGQIYNFGIDTTNSGNVTLNVNGQGAKAVLHKNSQQFAAGDLVATDSIYLYYDGTQFVPLAEQRSVNQGCIISGEAATNGNETITECAPVSLASSWSIIKPSSAGTAGQALLSGGAAGQQTWGSAGGSTVTLSATVGPFMPFGEPTGEPEGNSVKTASPNDAVCIDFVAPVAVSAINKTFWFQSVDDTGKHVAVAIYTAAGTLVQQSDTVTSNSGNVLTFTFAAAVNLTAGGYSFCMTSDSATLAMVANGTNTVGNLYRNAAADKHYFKAANSSTGTSTLTFNAATGARTAIAASSTTDVPAIALNN